MDIINFFLSLLCFFFFFVIKLIIKNNKLLNFSNWFILFIFVLLLFFVVFCFLRDNLFWFYVFFEVSLVPIFFIISLWGYQEERFNAAFYIISYTLIFSLPFLLYIIKLNINFRSTNNIIDCKLWNFILFLPFLVKLPIYYLHLWLPKAHVEAPTIGSIILAAILLKMGGYGLYRIFFLNKKNRIYVFYIFFMWGCVISRLYCLITNDLKTIIAYSSVRHMGIIVILLTNFSTVSLKRFLIVILSHGYCSASLFFIVGILQEKKNSRQLKLNRGIYFNIFVFWFWFLFLLSNFSIPPTINFFGELIMFICLLNFFFNFVFFICLLFFIVSLFCLYLVINILSININIIINFFLDDKNKNLLLIQIYPTITWIFIINTICLFNLKKI